MYQNHFSKCLFEQGQEIDTSVHKKKLLGTIFSLDEQCKHTKGPDSYFCSVSSSIISKPSITKISYKFLFSIPAINVNQASFFSFILIKVIFAIEIPIVFNTDSMEKKVTKGHVKRFTAMTPYKMSVWGAKPKLTMALLAETNNGALMGIV